MKQDTLLTTMIESSNDKPMYDDICKQLLSNKMILAWIMKECLSEYKNIEVEQIANKYIEGHPYTSSISVLTGEFIHGMTTEGIGLNEGKIVYDIRYRAIAPSDNGLIELLVNIEAQNQYNPGYPLVKRGIYYSSRMISGQYGNDFDKSDYKKIKKVYSIWLCRNVPKKFENSITSYNIIETNHIGNAVSKKINYDLMSVVMVYLGHTNDEQQSNLLRLLNILLSEEVKASEKLEILTRQFRIPATKNLENEVHNMCNLSQGIENKGIRKGIKQGIKQERERAEQNEFETAKRFLAMGLTIEDVAKGANLDLEIVRQLA